MAQRLVYGVLKLSSIFYFVVCHHSRQRLSRRWHKQLFALLLTLKGPWPKVLDNAKDLVKKMLNLDPKQRLTTKEVLEHSWLQNAKKAPNVPLGEIVKVRLKQFSVMNKVKKRALK
ncbi:hypothetical protein Golax_003753, partial [Gossypium laxum]|nr:hypothetical protein [Gossypium laxum]